MYANDEGKGHQEKPCRSCSCCICCNENVPMDEIQTTTLCSCTPKSSFGCRCSLGPFQKGIHEGNGNWNEKDNEKIQKVI